MTNGVEVAKRWFREAWGEERDEVADALLTVDCVAHGLGPEPIVGPADFRRFRDAMLAPFQVRVEVLQGLSDGDRAAVQCRATLTHRATGAAGTFTGACFFRLRDGRICESTNEWNFLDLLAQLEVVPPEGLGAILGAEKADALPRWR